MKKLIAAALLTFTSLAVADPITLEGYSTDMTSDEFILHAFKQKHNPTVRGEYQDVQMVVAEAAECLERYGDGKCKNYAQDSGLALWGNQISAVSWYGFKRWEHQG